MQPTARVTEDEYLAFENASPTKHELIHGRIVDMAGATPRHVAIVMNVIAALVPRLRGTGCRALASEQRIHVPATGLYTYPDVLVVCGALEMHPRDAITLLNPRLIVEVLSPSTEAYDRGAKFAHYRSIPSMRTYLLLSQDEPRAERFEKGDGAAWTIHEPVGRGAIVELPSIGVSIPVDELYVELPEA